MKQALRTVALVATHAIGAAHKTTKKANPPLPVGAMLAFLGMVLATLNPAHAQAPAASTPAPTPAPTPPIIIDDFSDVSKWKVVASDGVEGKVSLAEKVTRPDGKSGTALRLDFDFKKGSGYCIARRELDMPAPSNFRIGFWMFGGPTGRLSDGTPVGFTNDLEFKLYDQTGDNVWWVREAARSFEPKWTPSQYHRRQITFAWGPGGGRVPLERVTAIEFAVTAAAVAPGAMNLNRKGYVLFDDLTLETLPAPSTTPGHAVISVNGVPTSKMENGEAHDIRARADDGSATVKVDFGAPHEFGGLLIEWNGKPADVRSASASPHSDGSMNRPLTTLRVSDYTTILTHPEPEASNATIALSFPKGQSDATIKRLSLLPFDTATNPNARLALLASVSPRGWYPRSFHGEQVAWAPFGADGAEFEGLLSGDGQVEIAKGGRTIEPFLWANGHLWTWDDLNATTSLVNDRLPLPRVVLTASDLPVMLEVQPFATRESGSDGTSIRYRIQNPTDEVQKGRLMLALRGLQVLPPWHTLNLVGGSTQDRPHVSQEGQATDRSIRVGPSLVVGCSQPTGTLMFESSPHDIITKIATGIINEPKVRGSGDSGVLFYDYVIAPKNRVDFWVRSSVNQTAAAPEPITVIDANTLESASNEVVSDWRTRLHHITLKLPKQAKELEDSFYAQIGWILVNKDGPAIQPGSRTYDRTWIRDGALTATALLYTGHAPEVKEFLDWFRTFQYEDGKIPCCVDERGPDPVPEHDSHGQYIYGVATYHRFTHDDDLLKRHWGNVAAAVGYIEKLRATRMTAEYADPSAPAETRVKFGLVPESISHEGYSAKPMHSYWDDFFTLRGLTDAVYIAEKLGQNEQAAKWAVLRDDFSRTLVDSIRLAQKIKNITFVPGCAELGDYDPTSTAAALFPGGQADGPLGDSLRATFDRYIGWFRDRRDGRIEWKDYTPYEMRNASALLMLGHADQSHEVLDWMLLERASIGWRQWAEIGYKDKKAGKFVGDMPHTWVGSDYVKAVRNLCVYERERDHALVVGAGLKPSWLEAEGGVNVGGFPTEFGTLSYTASMKDGVTVFNIEAGTVVPPPGGIVVMPMMPGKMGTVTINGEPAKETGDGFVIVRALPAKVRIEAK